MMPVPSEKVAFAIALPPGWREVDLLDPDAAEGLGALLTSTLQRAAEGADHARLLMLRSLFAVTEKREPMAAGLSVLLADPAAPVSQTALRGGAFDDADVAAITLPVGAGLRVRRLVPAIVGDLRVAALQVQYLLHTEHGLLTITLETPQAAETADWEHLFDALAATARLR
jgi:hypothetical protein